MIKCIDVDIDVDVPYKKCIVDMIRNFFQIYPFLISEQRQNYWSLWPAQLQNPVTLRKQVTKYKHMQKWSNFSANQRVVALNLLALSDLE